MVLKMEIRLFNINLIHIEIRLVYLIYIKTNHFYLQFLKSL